MKFDKRIVPFTTVFLCNDKDFNDIVNQTIKWCSSDSFNPAGRAYTVNIETYTISIVNRLREKKIKPRKKFTRLSLIYFVLKIKPSLLISLSRNSISKSILFLSRAGRKVYPRGLFSFFLADTSFKFDKPPVIKKIAPYLYNSPDNEKFGYRTTVFRGMASENRNNGSIEIYDNDEDIRLDLGKIPENPEGDILWVPRRTTTKTVWTDFIKMTYFAEEMNCRINVQIKNEKDRNRFSTVFFIKGRKLDMDMYLNFIESEKLDEIIYAPEKFGIGNLEWVVFSFGLTTEYKRISGIINDNEENTLNLTTIKKLGGG